MPSHSSTNVGSVLATVPTFSTTIRDSKSVYGPAPEHGVPVILGGTGRAATRELRDLVKGMKVP